MDLKPLSLAIGIHVRGLDVKNAQGHGILEVEDNSWISKVGLNTWATGRQPRDVLEA